MTAQEFVQYMPADALAATIAHVVESVDPDKGNMIVNVCWRQLIALVGEYRATYMVFGNNCDKPTPQIVLPLECDEVQS